MAEGSSGQRGIAPTDQQQACTISQARRAIYCSTRTIYFRQFQQQTQAYHSKCRDNETLWRGKHWRATCANSQEIPQPRRRSSSRLRTCWRTLWTHNYPEPVLVGGGRWTTTPWRRTCRRWCATSSSAEGSAASIGAKYTRRSRPAPACWRSFGTNSSTAVWGCQHPYGGHPRFLLGSGAGGHPKGRAVFKATFQPLSYFRQRYPDQWRYIQPDYGGFTRADYVRLDPLTSESRSRCWSTGTGCGTPAPAPPGLSDHPSGPGQPAQMPQRVGRDQHRQRVNLHPLQSVGVLRGRQLVSAQRGRGPLPGGRDRGRVGLRPLQELIIADVVAQRFNLHRCVDAFLFNAATNTNVTSVTSWTACGRALKTAT